MLPLFSGFFKVGLFGFGGGPSMLPLMQAECVRAGWVSDEQFLEGLAVGYTLPGPISVKMAIYVGWIEAGALGSMAAVVGVCLPSIVLMSVLGSFLLRHRDHPWVAAALRGVKPAVVGMLAWVVWELAPTGVRTGSGAIVALVAFAALVGRLHPAMVIVLAAAVGVLLFR